MRLIFVAALIVIVSTVFGPGQAVAQNADTDLKTIDDFFDNPHMTKISGCDQPVWDAIHEAVRDDIQGRVVASSSRDNDMSLANRVLQCSSIVSIKEKEALDDLSRRVVDSNRKEAADVLAGSGDRASAAIILAINVEDERRSTISALEYYENLVAIEAFAQEASQSYLNDASEIRYRDLVARYNALTNSLANVRLAPGYNYSIQPVPLHCTSSTNSATGITQMDCQ